MVILYRPLSSSFSSPYYCATRTHQHSPPPTCQRTQPKRGAGPFCFYRPPKHNDARMDFRAFLAIIAIRSDCAKSPRNELAFLERAKFFKCWAVGRRTGCIVWTRATCFRANRPKGKGCRGELLFSSVRFSAHCMLENSFSHRLLLFWNVFFCCCCFFVYCAFRIVRSCVCGAFVVLGSSSFLAVAVCSE